MSTDITINGIGVSTLGFHLKGVEGHLGIGKPKNQGSGKDEYTSQNLFIDNYYQESPEPEIYMFAKFDSITLAESALYTLYGWLVQVGEHTFIHTDGTSIIQFKGIMHKGVKVNYELLGSAILLDLTLKILKTDV